VGNFTGVSVDAGIELWTKYLEMVRETVPMATKVGFLATRQAWDQATGRTLSEIAGQAGILLLGPPLASPINEEDYRRVLLAMAQERAGAVIVSGQNRKLRIPADDCWLGRRDPPTDGLSLPRIC
jgi:putative tryptophan/tyrosine transport system substrate-binding protein